MPSLPDPHRERIPVAAPRLAPRRAEQPPRSSAGEASGAGITILAVIGLITALGAIIGHQFDQATSGGLLRCFFGLIAGFAATYLQYHDV